MTDEEKEAHAAAVYRERLRRQCERYHRKVKEDPGYREHRNANQRARRADPEVRKQKNAVQSEKRRALWRRVKVTGDVAGFVKLALRSGGRAGLRASREELEARLRPMRCEATGVPMLMLPMDGPFTPHLDRIDPKGGYVIGNVRWVCAVYNFGKRQWSHEDFMVVAKAAVQKYA